MSVNIEPSVFETIEIDGWTLRVAEIHRGSTRPLLICNDFLGTIEVLEEFRQALDRTTLGFDWPGLRGTRGPSTLRRMGGLAQVVAKLIERRSQAPIDLLGIGWGGLLAQRIARDYPALVNRLILIATSTGPLMFPGRLGNLRRLAMPNGLKASALDGREARRIFGGRRSDECQRMARALARAGTPTHRGYIAQLYALAGFSSLPWLYRLKMPTLVLAGDDDPIVPLVNARVLALMIPRSQLSIMRGAGHWLVLERPDEAARRIAAFLDLAQPLQHDQDEPI